MSTKTLRIIDGIGWTAAALVLTIYLFGSPTAFDVANVLLCVPMALPPASRRVWPATVVPLAFGLFGFLHLIGVHV